MFTMQVPWKARYRLLGGVAALLVTAVSLAAQLPPSVAGRAELSPLRSYFIAPVRVVWQSEAGVQNAANLLQPKPGQAVLKEPQPPCVLTPADGKPAGLVLDFGAQRGAQLGQKLGVNQGTQPIATVLISDVRPNLSIAQVLPDSLRGVLQKGDHATLLRSP